MNKGVVAALFSIVALGFGGCASSRSASDGKGVVKLAKPRLFIFIATAGGPIGRVSFHRSKPNPNFGNGRAKLTVSNSNLGTKWGLYTVTPPNNPSLNPGDEIPASYLVKRRVKIIANSSASIIDPGYVPLEKNKLTTIHVTYTN